MRIVQVAALSHFAGSFLCCRARAPELGLRIFQTPAGADLEGLRA